MFGGVADFVAVSADGGFAGDAHFGDADAGEAVADGGGFAGGEEQGNGGQADAEGEDGLCEGGFIDGVEGLKAAHLGFDTGKGEGDAGLPVGFE